MELTQLINSIKVIKVVGEIQRIDVSSITYDSRKVKKNAVFAAIKGYKSDGHKFILEAVSKGAVAVILEDETNAPDNIFIQEKVLKILVKNSRKAMAEISNVFFKEPSKKLKLFGITGTNGKTTTSYIIRNILETAGEKTGLLGTISNFIGNKEISSTLTTPESNELNELLFEMYSEGCSSAVMEVSSHSLVLNRVHDIHFEYAVFTNLTTDHLDFHQNSQNYFQAKKILFDNLSAGSKSVYNFDDQFGEKIISDSRAKCYSYGAASNSDFHIMDINFDLNGTRFTIEHKNHSYSISTSLIGEFNAYNVCAAFAITLLAGIDTEKILLGIKTTPQVPGRFEVLSNADKKVIIDYSHTPDSLLKALQTIRKLSSGSRPVYTVFGCGGDRDQTKRAEMGRIASSLSDKVIITSDNPRSEDPIQIIEMIRPGITSENFSIIEDREMAIKSAIEKAEKNAVILIAGKGHETYQEIKGKRISFNDKLKAQHYLSR